MNTNDLKQDVEYYVRKAITPFFGNESQDETLSTYQVAKCISIQFPLQYKYWIDNIQSVSDEMIDTIFCSIPNSYITDVSIDFAKNVLELNKQFLSDLL